MKQLSLLILFILPFSIKAQLDSSTTCAEKVLVVSKLYNQGKTELCLLNCQTLLAQENLEKQCRWQTLRLLAMASIAEGKKAEARKAVEALLEINPTYKPSVVNDPADFIKMLRSVTVIPKFSLGLAFALGANFSLPQVEKSYRLADYEKKYQNKNGYQVGVSFAYFLSENTSIELNLLNTQKAFTINYEMPNWKFEVMESLNYLELPILIRQYVPLRTKLKPYLQGGLFMGTLVYTENSFKASFEPEGQEYSLNKIDSRNRRNLWNTGISFGTGLSYKMKSGYLTLQCNYFKSFKNISNHATKFNYPQLEQQYYYLDDDFIINNIALSIGFAYPLNYKVIQNANDEK